MSEPITDGISTGFGALRSQCDLLRSLHVPGRPLVLPREAEEAGSPTRSAASED
jgi:hypothetical protein